MKVQITGDREWTDYQLIRDTLLQFGATEVVHGAARGADHLAGHAAYELGLRVHSYPADWAVLGRRAGPVRNILMIRKHPDSELVLAFHDDIDSSSGTRHMIFEVSLPAGKPVYLTGHTDRLPSYLPTYPGKRLDVVHYNVLQTPCYTAFQTKLTLTPLQTVLTM